MRSLRFECAAAEGTRRDTKGRGEERRAYGHFEVPDAHRVQSDRVVRREFDGALQVLLHFDRALYALLSALVLRDLVLNDRVPARRYEPPVTFAAFNSTRHINKNIERGNAICILEDMSCVEQ